MESQSKGNILIIDPQARGHALSCLLSQSGHVDCVYLSRRSPLPQITGCPIIPLYWLEELKSTSYEKIVNFCHSKNIRSVIVGTADAMVEGLVDYLKTAGLSVLGATKQAVLLESDKSFSKSFFNRHSIPTPRYKAYFSQQALVNICSSIFPCFIKSDLIIRSHYSAVKVNNKEEATKVSKSIFAIQQSYYGYKSKVILEELVEGEELSFSVLMVGQEWVALPISRDYKALSEGNTAVNTSGMGAISPVDDVGVELYQSIVSLIVEPVIKALNEEHLDYNGFLYFGIMIDNQQRPTLLELNCRLGDPEAQTIFPLFTPSLVQALLSAASGHIDDALKYPAKKGYVCSVYAVPDGYPTLDSDAHVTVSFETLEPESECQYFWGELLESHEPQTLLTRRNRMFCVTAKADTLEKARKVAYHKLSTVVSSGLYFRRDIGVELKKGKYHK